MPSFKKIRLAVIGSGHLGRYHARLAAANDAFELVAVVDPIAGARKQLADELHVRALSDHASLVSEIDAAVVATPTVAHHQVGIDLLMAGIHLLVEKPLAADLRQANELVDCAAANGCTLQVGHVERFNPALEAVRDRIDQPKYIETRRFSGYAFRSMDISVVLDLMIHDLDIVLHLVGAEPVRVDAIGASVLGPHEDVANARIAFANGCIANLSASRISYELMRQMHVWCPQSFVAIDFSANSARVARPSESILRGEFNPETLGNSEIQAAKDRFFQDCLPVEDVVAEPRNALADELADFAAAINSGQPPRVPAAAGRDALAVCESILDSIQHHCWDAHTDGRIGPKATGMPSTIPVASPQTGTARHRRAG